MMLVVMKINVNVLLELSRFAYLVIMFLYYVLISFAFYVTIMFLFNCFRMEMRIQYVTKLG